MKTLIKLILLTLLFAFGVDDIKGQMTTSDYAEEGTISFKTCNVFKDSENKPTTDTSRSNVIQVGIGLGYMMKGGFMGFKGKFVSSIGLGAGLDFKFGTAKTQNLPSNYSPLIYPRDNLTVGSLNIVKVLTSHGQNPRFSIAVGPSLVKIDNAILTPNPDYDPSSIWHLSRYFRSREVIKSFGLSINTETEILLSSFMIIDFSVFANLNKAASFLGIGIYINFGDVKD